MDQYLGKCGLSDPVPCLISVQTAICSVDDPMINGVYHLSLIVFDFTRFIAKTDKLCEKIVGTEPDQTLIQC